MKKTVTARAELIEVGRFDGSPALRFSFGKGSTLTMLVSADEARAWTRGLYQMHDVTVTVETPEVQS